MGRPLVLTRSKALTSEKLRFSSQGLRSDLLSAAVNNKLSGLSWSSSSHAVPRHATHSHSQPHGHGTQLNR